MWPISTGGDELDARHPVVLGDPEPVVAQRREFFLAGREMSSSVRPVVTV
jgi:hypothetical protein